MNMDLPHQLNCLSVRERNHTAPPLHPLTLTLGPSMYVFSLPIYLDMEQAQRGHLSNPSEHLRCHDDCYPHSKGLSYEALLHHCFPMGLRQTARQRAERGKAARLANSHYSMISCSQKGLPSPTVIDEQSRRALSPPMEKQAQRVPVPDTALESPAVPCCPQALRKGYRAEGGEIGKLTFPQRTSKQSLPFLTCLSDQLSARSLH